MHDTRVIIAESGNSISTGQIAEHLVECGAQVTRSFRLISGVAAGMSADALRQLLSRYPGVTLIPDRQRQIPPLPFSPDDLAEIGEVGSPSSERPAEPEVSPLALTLMKVEEVNRMGITGEGVRICIIDSGVDFTHPDLIGTAVTDADGNPLAIDFTETDLTDTIGHGTGVAGCIVSQARQVYTIHDEQTGEPIANTRIRGVAPAARLMSAKVFDARVPSGYDSAIIAALEWAAEQGAQVINMSLGGEALPNDGTDLLAAAVTALRQQGILVVVSAGNEGGGVGSLSSPGSSPGALTAGASTAYRSFAELRFLADSGKWAADQLASFSSLGPAADGRVKPDLLAPGAFDWSLAPVADAQEGRLFQLFGGTSQAAPFVTGVAALVYQAFRRFMERLPTPDEVVRILCSTADDLGLPAHMQGAGRVNALRAVKLAQGDSAAVVASPPNPIVVPPGQEGTLTFDLANIGIGADSRSIRTRRFAMVDDQGLVLNGQIATAESPQQIPFDVTPGTDLMQVSLGWISREVNARSPRLLLALYDPHGRFVNYQRPSSSGDVELGKNVDTWVACPEPGRWTARVVLRLGRHDTVQGFTLSVRAYRAGEWDWVQIPSNTQALRAGEHISLTLKVHVPDSAPAGTYCGHLLVGHTAVPFSVVVPITLEKGMCNFSGTFQHGYQGTWGNGDWIYYDLPLPVGTRSIVTAVQWPDADNALECYLIDPRGNPVAGRSNNQDMLDDGSSDVMGGQMVWAGPEPGLWRLALHSFAFCGRGMPEPYFGFVELGEEIVSPQALELTVPAGEQAAIALMVRNPGRMPLLVKAVARTDEARLIWRTLMLRQRVDPMPGEGEPRGETVLTTLDVPHGTRQMGLILNWSPPDLEMRVRLADPVVQSDRISATGRQGQIVLMHGSPVPGTWRAVADIRSTPGQEVEIRGATFMVAPQPIREIAPQTALVQPGAVAMLPLTVKAPDQGRRLSGRILVTAAGGDRLGDVGFRIKVR